MDWNDHIYRYCERGSDPALWAEPLNALTNVAFVVAAMLALRALVRRPAGSRGMPEAVIVGLMFAIGTGSFLFHTYATRWASYADSVPIGIFMMTYCGYALRRLLGLGWPLVVLGLAIFAASLNYAGSVQCDVALVSKVAAVGQPCLNGTAGYVPAFFAMAIIGTALAINGHPASKHLWSAAGVFLVSMGFRSIDREICELTRMMGHAMGTHFMWHILNATVLYLLAMAAIRFGSEPRGRLAERPA